MFGETELWFVDTPDKLRDMVAELSKAPVIGVDTESDSFHHYQEKVCLIQFSDHERDYILDPLAVGDISSMGPIFADRDSVKIFHGADYDVVCMKRDFGFEIHNIFDTMIGAQMAGYERFGLADLIEGFFGHHIDKKYQRHDWAKRPLHDEHIQYARGDTHFLLAIREIMIRRLKQVGRLRHLREECRILEQRKWAPREVDPAQWMKTKGSGHLDPNALRVLRALWNYRDAEAQRADRPHFKILPDSVLVRVAERQPGTFQELDNLFSGKMAMKKRYGKGMLAAVEEGLEDDSALPDGPRKKRKRKKAKGPKARIRGKEAERVQAALKTWRNGLTRGGPLYTPITTASNSVLREIARARPTNLDELEAIPDVRRWQVRDFGEDILEVLDDAAPWPPPDSEDKGKSGSKRGRRKS